MTGSLKKGEEFWGTGESFLWKLGRNDLTIYKATMDNSYFHYCDEDGIGFGAEDFHGLFIDKELGRGSSHKCKTYGNDVLNQWNEFGDEPGGGLVGVGEEGKGKGLVKKGVMFNFGIQRLEVWGFVGQDDW